MAKSKRQAPPDTDDQEWLKAISESAGDKETADRIHRFYRDADRADRTPREVMYFHLGLLAGIIAKLNVCADYRPDHNGECLNCDEPADAHASKKGRAE